MLKLKLSLMKWCRKRSSLAQVDDPTHKAQTQPKTSGDNNNVQPDSIYEHENPYPKSKPPLNSQSPSTKSLVTL